MRKTTTQNKTKPKQTTSAMKALQRGYFYMFTYKSKNFQNISVIQLTKIIGNMQLLYTTKMKKNVKSLPNCCAVSSIKGSLPSFLFILFYLLA